MKIKVGDRVRIIPNRKKMVVTIYKISEDIYYGMSDRGTRYEVYESDLELVNSSKNSSGSETTNSPEIPDSSKPEPTNKIYEVFSRDLSMDSRQFSTLDAAVGCFQYQIDSYKGWDVDLRELTPNEIKEYAFTKLLARYSSDDSEVSVFDPGTEQAFIELEYVKRLDNLVVGKYEN